MDFLNKFPKGFSEDFLKNSQKMFQGISEGFSKGIFGEMFVDEVKIIDFSFLLQTWEGFFFFF